MKVPVLPLMLIAAGQAIAAEHPGKTAYDAVCAECHAQSEAQRTEDGTDAKVEKTGVSGLH